jgi:hypothetical protein
MQRINFTESTLNTLKKTANCSFANAVYKLTMKAQQGLKCDDLYKKSVLMNDVNKILCNYKLDTCISFHPALEGGTNTWTFGLGSFTGTISYYLNIDGVNVFIGAGNSAANIVTDIINNSDGTGVTASLDGSYITITSPVGCFVEEDLTSIKTPAGTIPATPLVFLASKCAQEETCIDYTEEQLNCITPQDLQVLYEFTHKYKETLAKSTKKISNPSSNTNTSNSTDCCTWGSIGGSIGNQSDLVNYLATVEKNMISVKDEGTEITGDVKSINFVGSGVTAASVNSNVTVTIPGGGGGSTFECSDLVGCDVSLLNNDAGYITEVPKYTVDNGLTESPANNFQLGGILIQNTTIDTDTNELLITTSTSPSAPLAVENLNSDDSTDVDGIDVYSEVGVAGVFEINHYSDSNIFPVLELKRNSSTSSRNYDGLGGAIDFYLRKNDGTYTGYPTARIAAKWLASATTDSQIELWAHSNGFQKRIATFNIDTTPRSGQINFEEYGLGNFAVSNPDYLLAVNGAGDIIESENVVKTFKRIITSAELASVGANQIIAAPGAGKAINVIEASIKLDYNGIAYTPVLAGIGTTGGGLFGIPTSFFTATSNQFAKMYDINTYQYADSTTYISNLVENSPINFTVVTPSSVGNSTITVYGLYRIIDL